MAFTNTPCFSRCAIRFQKCLNFQTSLLLALCFHLVCALICLLGHLQHNSILHQAIPCRCLIHALVGRATWREMRALGLQCCHCFATELSSHYCRAFCNRSCRTFLPLLQTVHRNGLPESMWNQLAVL